MPNKEQADLVSIIMSVYNEEENWLEEAFYSLLNQTYKNIEIIVILDNPKNRKLNEIIKKFERKNDNIRLVINEKNLGLVKSLNKGIKIAQGEYIARMDADDVCKLDRIEQEINFLKKEHVDFVFTDVIMINEKSEIISNPLFSPSLSPTEVESKIRWNNISTHPTWLMKRQVYERLEGYREIDFCEDYDFSLRSIANGFQIAKIGNPMVYYRLRKNSISRSYALEQFLKSRYLAKKFRKKKLLIEEPHKINQKYFNLLEKDKSKFLLAWNYFIESKVDFKEKRYKQSLLKVIKSFLKSRYIILLALDSFMNTIIK